MSAQGIPLKSDFRERARVNDIPVARLIGFEAKEMANGRATVMLMAGPQNANPMGTQHGGILCDVCRKVDPVGVTSAAVRDKASTPLDFCPNLGTPSPTKLFCS